MNWMFEIEVSIFDCENKVVEELFVRLLKFI